MDEPAGVGNAELGDDVALHGRGGRGGEGDDRRGAQGREILSQHSVVGAEIVSPLRDAVGFVDGDEGRFAFGQHFGEAGDAQALGGDEEKLQRAGKVVDAGLAAY